uniref:Cilia and flagella associated protein 46 n=1 Tax=Oncorhynchus mykiss TaxID=8022 RepID=A0A8C7V183_ONCMY
CPETTPALSWLCLGCADISRDCLMMYFEGKPPANQFLCRAYLCQGQLESPQSFGSVEEIEKAVIYFLKAIEISKVKPRYHFLVFNASVLYFQMVRPLLRSGPRQHLVPTLTQVVKALEEVGEQDYSWRAQLMMHLVECLVDAGKGKEASSFAKATSDFIESHIPDLYPKIFSLQVKPLFLLLLCAQLKVIGRLDKVLQSAVREGDAKVMQAVCASQWNTCLPLLQHNLRRNVKGALLKVAQVLEDTYSVQLEMRCQVHSELAVIEEEEGRLEPALLHLQRALLLDERGVHHERLTSALNLLQLRGTLYQTPSSTEDQAAMLIQQAKNGQPQEEVRKRRPMLVNAGLTLAPDAFQVVLDADSTSGPGGVAHLSAKAQHHSACVEKVQGHLSRQGDGKNDRERVKLWAALAKTARKQEVWDVCRAACRFCLLYDDGRWKATKSDCEELSI